MSYTQTHENKQFPPNSTFPDHCFFKGCTFKATCTFGIGCHFIGCTFMEEQDNPPSVIKEGIVESSTLAAVTLESTTLSVNNKDTKKKTQDKGWHRDGTYRGQSDDVCICYCVSPVPCAGVSIAPADNKPSTIQTVANCTVPCDPNQGFGDSQVTYGQNSQQSDGTPK